mgnify:CR=1 FL=1
MPATMATEDLFDQGIETMVISEEEVEDITETAESEVNNKEQADTQEPEKRPEQIIYTGSGLSYGSSSENGFLVSFDSGATWEERNEGLPHKSIYPFDRDQVRQLTAIGVDPKNNERVIVSTKNQLFISENYGETWEPIPFSNGSIITALALSPFNSEHILVGTSFAGFYQTLNKGQTWSLISKDVDFLYQSKSNQEEISALAYNPEEPDQIVFSCGFGNGLYLYNKNKKTVKSLNLTNAERPLIENLLFKQSGTKKGGENSETDWLLQITRKKSIALYSWPDFQLVAEEEKLKIGEDNPDKQQRLKRAANKYGIYVRSDYAHGKRLEAHLDFMEKNGLNAMVVDFKDDSGYVTYDTQVPLAKKAGAIRKRINIKELIGKTQEHQVYLIGRIVVFKDNRLYQYDKYKYAAWDRYTDQPWRYMVKEKNSAGEEIYIQREHWLDPFSSDVWEYNIAIAEELEALGVDEIQFDYIRFPTDGNLERIIYKYQPVGTEKIDALESFLAMARERLQIPISTDLYGYNCWYRMEGLTGQNIRLFSKYVDVICPMYYPSHFSSGFLPGDYLERAELIYKEGSFRANTLVTGNSIIRPYVQAFLLNWEFWMTPPVYTEYLLKQVNGVLSSGIPGFTLWNNSNRYYMVKKPLKEYLLEKGYSDQLSPEIDR